VRTDRIVIRYDMVPSVDFEEIQGVLYKKNDARQPLKLVL
jgi:hypothetical protein